MRRYFLLNREILQSKNFQYFDQSKKGHDRAKFGLASQHDRPPFKNYFEPCQPSSIILLQLSLNSKSTIQDLLPGLPILFLQLGQIMVNLVLNFKVQKFVTN